MLIMTIRLQVPVTFVMQKTFSRYLISVFSSSLVASLSNSSHLFSLCVFTSLDLYFFLYVKETGRGRRRRLPKLDVAG